MEYNEYQGNDSFNTNNEKLSQNNLNDQYMTRKKVANTNKKASKKASSKHSQKSKKKKSKLKAIIILLFIVVIATIAIVAININNTVKDFAKENTNLVINSNNVTAKLKHNVLIKEDTIYVSMDDIKNYFDKYIEIEEDINKIITTGDVTTAEISFEQDSYIKINGVTSKVQANAIKEDDIVYLPLSKMLKVYNIEVNYIETTNIVVVDSINRELKQATITKNAIVREKKRNLLSNALEKLNSGSKVYVISDDVKGWTKIRTSNGIIGYVKTDILSDTEIIQEAYSFVSSNKLDGKVNMFWDLFSETSSAPDRTGQTIEGVNVVSPTFLYIDKNGNLKANVGESGEKYIAWAKEQGYQIWPRVSNDLAGIDVTSTLLNSYEARQKLISDLVNTCMLYGFDGVNIDFEYMYQKDKDVFSKLIIEMVPIMRDAGGVIVSVDVTIPDGSPNWSLCYDRNVLGDVADYLVFMAYDQYASGSKTAGTTAGYNWVKNGIEKFINNEEVDSEKIILGIPFYTRIWTETADSVVSKVVEMKDVDEYIPSGVEKKWDDTLKQYYVEYTSGNTTKKMWIEDLESIKAKCSLVKTYNLAGVAAWEKDREDSGVWDIILDALK